ncbi:MAG: hypothetical protein KBB11_04280 [Bacteroidales bacterium]|nr:hypothetical protein [Bacteroidales bacterium]HOY38705.1 tocopherol cyclase family protein [Bacteroidales bacterium]
MNKNRFSLTRSTSKQGYDWWWHSFVAENANTGELKPFFIEYYVINPGLFAGDIVWGQKGSSENPSPKPCYAMIKAGTWGAPKAQLHDFYKISDFEASTKELNCRIGNNEVTEKSLKGQVVVTTQETIDFPERMSDAGTMQWDLSVEKHLSYDVGYGSSHLLNALNAFEMFWHVGGMRCSYRGTVTFDGVTYIVKPETSYGYQDKNWGKNYTNPWIWLNCNHFVSKKTGEPVDASLDIGGGCPKVFGISLKRRIITALYYNNNLIEFNFSKFWKFSSQQFSIREDDDKFYWNVVSTNRQHKIEVDFSCEKSTMLFVNYESPDGKKLHNKLWNGGHAKGSVKIYRKQQGEFHLIEELDGSMGGCEYGEY